ncbi:hypothetical protein QFZ82_007637 [Streptomyces sp. V4I23]|uniref:hypothetical protein n=1 Tax=Streptomyces sp. V4I23 TaxID=3042282 RepID=UPI00277DECB4|nr:hypothetical protein [Streptomyces sp. V4I23]MDQ1013152.1 hypothetical protein [Streptomyces sp. V4I23]
MLTVTSDSVSYFQRRLVKHTESIAPDAARLVAGRFGALPPVQLVMVGDLNRWSALTADAELALVPGVSDRIQAAHRRECRRGRRSRYGITVLGHFVTPTTLTRTAPAAPTDRSDLVHDIRLRTAAGTGNPTQDVPQLLAHIEMLEQRLAAAEAVLPGITQLTPASRSSSRSTARSTSTASCRSASTPTATPPAPTARTSAPAKACPPARSSPGSPTSATPRRSRSWPCSGPARTTRWRRTAPPATSSPRSP